MMRFLTAFLMLVSVGFGQTVMDLSSSSPSVTKTVTKAMGVVRPSSANINIYGKLILEAGAILEMPSNSSLTAQFSGVIDCRGTAEEPVTIRSQSGVTWCGIRSFYRQTGSYRPQITLTHTNMTGLSGGFQNAAIEAQYAVIFMDNVTITMPRNNQFGPTKAIELGPNMTNSTTGITYNCTGIISNCRLIGMTSGIADKGKSVDFIDIETVDVVTPFVWQWYATPQHFYHRFSVER